MKTKTRFHKLTAWVLTLAMLMTFIPSFTLTTFAADSIVAWNDADKDGAITDEEVTYSRFTDAVEAGINGTASYIRLNSDISGKISTISVDKGTFTIDLNGHDLALDGSSSGVMSLSGTANVTFTDSSDSDSWGTVSDHPYGFMYIEDNAALTIDGGNYSGLLFFDTWSTVPVTINSGNFMHSDSISGTNIVFNGGTFSYPLLYGYGKWDLSNYPKPEDLTIQIYVNNSDGNTYVTLADDDDNFSLILPDGYVLLDKNNEKVVEVPAQKSFVCTVGIKLDQVKFYKNKGDEEAYAVVQKGGDMPTNPTKDGYIFDGWFTENGTPLTTTANITADVTVYAKWKFKGTTSNGSDIVTDGDKTNAKWDYVYFGTYNNSPIKWRVLSKNGNGGTYKDSKNNSVTNAMFLFSDKAIKEQIFRTMTNEGITTGIPYSDYDKSEIRTWLLNDFITGSFTEDERNNILKTTKTDIVGADFEELYNIEWYPCELIDDTVFLISAQEIYEYISEDEKSPALAADDMNGNPIVTWWLRSKGTGKYSSGTYWAGTYNAFMTVPPYYKYYVRPAINLHSDNILFTSAASGSKTEAFGAVATYSGNEYKLTMKDSERSSFTAEVLKTDDNKLYIAYSGAKTGDNEYISAIVKNADGDITHYGRLGKVTSESGSLEYDMSGITLEATDKLYIFNEQYNGDYKTDFASELYEITVPDEVNAYFVKTTLENTKSSNTAEIHKIATDYNAILTASSGYVLPNEIEVKIDGTVLEESEYTYDIKTDTTAELIIKSEKITGNIEIGCEAVYVEKVTFTVSGDEQIYESGMARKVTVTPSHLTAEDFDVIYYEVDENEGVLKSVDAVTNAVAPGKYLYVIKFKEAQKYYTIEKEFTVTDTALPDISAYDNVGYMLIKSGVTGQQTPIYFDSPVVNVYKGDAEYIENNLTNNNGTTATLTSNNENVAKIENGKVKVVGEGSAVIIATSSKAETQDVYASYTLNVSKKTITVTAEDKTAVYGTAESAITNGYTLSENVTVNADNVKYDIVGYSANSGVGRYEIRVSGLSSDDYNFEYVSGELTVTAKELSLSDFDIAASDKFYDGNGTATISASVKAGSLVTGDIVTVLIDGAFDAYTAGEQNISYEITGLSGVNSNNYKLTGELTGDITKEITKALVTVSVPANTTYVYDGNEKSVNAVATANGLYFSDFDVTYKKGEDAATTDAPSDEGTYTIGINITNDNYELDGTISATLEIKAAQQDYFTIEGIPDTVYYGDEITLQTAGAIEGGTVTYEIVSGEDFVTLDDNKITADAVGTVTVKATSTKTNYAAKSTQRTFTIKPLPVNVTATASNKTYDGTKDVTVTLTLDGVLDGDNVTASYTSAAMATADVENAKTVFVNGITINNANYQLTSTSVQTTVNVTKKEITAVEFTADGKVYDGNTNATYTVTKLDDVADADKDFVTVTGKAAFDTATVGTEKTVTLSDLVLSGTKSGNYELKAENATAKAAITQETVTFTFGTLSYVYDGKAKTVPVTAEAGGKAFTDFTVKYGDADSQTNVGTYNVNITLTDATNYKTEYANDNKLEITTADQAELTITGLLGTIDYGKSFVLTAVGGSGTGTVTWKSSDESVATVSAAGVVEIKGVDKEVTITATKPADGNYAKETASVSFTPAKKAVAIKITNLTQTYDGDAKSVTVANASDFTHTVTYTDESGASSTTAPTNAGTYYVDVTANGNYEGTQSAVLTIKKAKLDTNDITITVPANLTYGTAYDVTTSYTGTDGVITYTGTGIYRETTDKPEDAGSYTAILTITNGNYDVATVEKDFEIKKATLYAKPDPASRAYGESNPVFTVSYYSDEACENKVTADVLVAPTMTTAANSSSNVGTHDIIAQGGYAENYTFSYVPGVLTISKATGGNFYISGGNTNPYVGNKFTLKAYYNNETPTVKWTSSNTDVATVNETTGEVEIVGTGDATITATMNDSRFASGLTATFELTAARLPETQTPIYFDDVLVEKQATDAAFTNTAKGVSDGAEVKYKSSNTNVATVNETTGEVTILTVGSTTITATATKFNCQDVYATYTLVVKKIPVTITADDVTVTYGETVTGTATFSDGLSASDFDGTLGFTTRYTAGKDADEYDITPNGLTSDIYEIEFVPGTITVTEKTLTADNFTVIAESKVYDGTSDVTISAAVNSLAVVSGDNLTVEIYGSFEDENAADGKTVNYEITGLSGRGYENYVIDGGIITGTETADITPCEVTFFVSAETVKGYDGNVHSVEISAMAGGNVYGNENYTVYYEADGEKTTEPTNVGEYTVSVELADDSGNYVIKEQPSATLKIETDPAAELVITGSGKNVTVGDMFTLRAEYGNTRPDVTWTSNDEEIATVNETTGEVTILKSGDVTITATMNDANYGGLATELELVAAKKRITLSASATELIKTYNGEVQNVTFTAGALDLTDVTIDTTYVMTTDADNTEPMNAGTYAVSYVIDDERYEGDGNFTLVINKATVTISADAIAKEYGEDPEYKAVVTEGITGVDANSVLSLIEFASDGAEKTANVGAYDITVTLVEASDDNCNYVVSNEANGQLTVTPATLTVNVADMSREYGAENPTELVYEITGFKNEETAEILTGSLTPVYAETIGTAVGTYEDVITTAGALENGNYNVVIAYTDGDGADLTITKIPVTASAGTSKSTYLTVKFDKALDGLTAENFVVKNGEETITLTEVTASSDNKTYTLKGSFQAKVTYTVETTIESETHEITSGNTLSIKPTSSGSGGSAGVGAGGGGGISTTTYTVTFETNEGSKIDSVKVTANATVTKPTAPTKDGYTFDGWYTDKELTTAYDFETKVTKSFTLYAKWTEVKTEEPDDNKPGTSDIECDGTIADNCPSLDFDDLDVKAWYHLDTDYVIENGIFKGTTETTFAPNDKLTRAMLVTILYRAEGEAATNRSIPFADVDMGSYYANAVIWAKQNGIVNGVSETEFAPDDNITREQIAAIMFRYAQYKGVAPTGAWAIRLTYSDLAEISDYALDAVMYCKLAEIMQGKDNNSFAPQDNATRAEIAAILHRFIEANK